MAKAARAPMPSRAQFSTALRAAASIGAHSSASTVQSKAYAPLVRAVLPILRRQLPIVGLTSSSARDAAFASRWVRSISSTASSAWGNAGSTSYETSRAPTSDALSSAEDRANTYPHHASYQAAYLQLLNRAGMHDEVLRRAQSGAFASDSDVMAEVGAAQSAVGMQRHGSYNQSYSAPPPPPSYSGAGYSQPQGAANHAAGGGFSRQSNSSYDDDSSGGGGNRRYLGSQTAPISVQLVPAKIGARDVLAFVLRFVAMGLVLTLAWRLMSQSSGDDGGIMSAFGGSRTKSVDEEGAVPDVKFDDVKGVDDAKKELLDVVEFLRNPERFQKLGARVPKGVLLTGPPGTGKTLLARAVAGESGVKFFNKSAAEFEEVFVGLGAKRVRELFETAKANAPAIIFIDEIDAVGGKRRASPGGRPGSERQTLNQLLAAMDGFDKNDNVIVIAATNDPDSLDSALRRPGRFDSTVQVSPPDMAGRVETFQLYMKKITMAAGVDPMILAKATPGFTGAQIEAIVNSAAIMAASRGAAAVDMFDMEEAMDKQWMGPAHRSRKKTEEMMRLTAFHEAGHTLAALYTNGAKELHKVTVLGRGNAGGVTHFFADDSAPANRTKLMADLDVAFGGLVAEELCNGYENVTTGPFSDLQQATDVARRYVKYFGMSKVGFSQYSQDHEGSEAYKQLVDEEVEALLQASYKRCKALLQSRWHEVARLADTLVERETLTADEVKVVVKGGKLQPLEEVLAQREAARGQDKQEGAVSVPKGKSGAGGSKGSSGASKGWLPPLGVPSAASIFGGGKADASADAAPSEAVSSTDAASNSSTAKGGDAAKGGEALAASAGEAAAKQEEGEKKSSRGRWV